MKSDVKDPAYVIWGAENSMLMTWLANSVAEDIGANYLYYSIDLWDNGSHMYSDLRNLSQLYELTVTWRNLPS